VTEELVRLDMVCFTLEDEPWVVTVSARWEALSLYAGDLVFLRVRWVMSHFVNARNRDGVTGLEYVANLRHDLLSPSQVFCQRFGSCPFEKRSKSSIAAHASREVFAILLTKSANLRV
jgi:hypothetical protein